MSRLPIEDFDSTPTMPLTDVQKARFSEAAVGLEQARTQGYVEANFANQIITLAKELATHFGLTI
jgi:hypothetical protein